MTRCRIDHLAIVAPDLASGAALVFDTLGVMPQPGGEHPRMGTHNLLLRLGDALFLEVIAANPAAPPPVRPRWFGLDQRAPDASPRLATWVVGTDDIHATAAGAAEPLGDIETMTRGELAWLITIPPDGALVLDGVAPALIQWPQGRHPATSLDDLGCALVKLEVCHPEPARIGALLAHLHLAGDVVVVPLPRSRPGHLIAHFDTPCGRRVLSGATGASA